MAQLLGDVRGFLKDCPSVRTESESPNMAFKEGSFIDACHEKDQPFYEMFVKTYGFLSYLQTLRLYEPGDTPFDIAVSDMKNLQAGDEKARRGTSDVGLVHSQFSFQEIQMFKKFISVCGKKGVPFYRLFNVR